MAAYFSRDSSLDKWFSRLLFCLVSMALIVLPVGSKAIARGLSAPPELILKSHNIDQTNENLMAALDNGQLVVRIAAARVLAKQKNMEALPLIKNLFNGTTGLSVSQKSELAYSLAQLKDKEGIAYLRSLCDQDEDKWHRAEAAYYLALTNDSYGYQAVVDVINFPDIAASEDRAAFENALDRFWIFSKFEGLDFITPIKKLLRDPSPRVRRMVITVFERAGDPSAVPILKTALEGETDIEIAKMLRWSINCLSEPPHICIRPR